MALAPAMPSRARGIVDSLAVPSNTLFKNTFPKLVGRPGRRSAGRWPRVSGPGGRACERLAIGKKPLPLNDV
jgi:hypothetical protein